MFMPFKDPGDYRDHHRNLFWNRYNSDPEFRETEAARKAKWYWEHRDEILARQRARYAVRRDKRKTLAKKDRS
jgi:hypothetical protein